MAPRLILPEVICSFIISKATISAARRSSEESSFFNSSRFLIKEPNLIVLDEPTGTMDPITRVIVTDSILKARTELEQTFIIISHDMDFVLDVCDRAALMRGGKLLDIGTPEEIVEKLTADEKEDMLKENR